MQIDSFKELLIKRASEMPDLQTLLKHMKDDFLIEYVMESLEKAATHKKPNASVIEFGRQMDQEREPKMIHDALSHHASHYKAALNKGNKSLANKHMKQFFNIMDLASKITKDAHGNHSKDKLDIEAPAPNPWERHLLTNTINRKGVDTGKFVTDPKGWSRATDDYSYLAKQPYPGQVNKSKHKGAYPLEEIKVNGKYLDINPDSDSVDVSGSTPNMHEFDHHPIMGIHNDPPAKHTSEAHSEYNKKAQDYIRNSPHLDSFEERMDNHYPDRGSIKSAPVHDGTITQTEQPQIEQSVQSIAKPASASQQSYSPEDITRMQAKVAERVARKGI